MRSTRLRAAGLAGAALFLVGACSSGGGASASPSTAATAVPTVAPSVPAASVTPSAAAIVVPDAIKTAGKLVWCVDISYPPEEFYKPDGTTPQGSDVDIANEVAKRFGVTAEIDNTGFSGIIPALLAKKCDLIVSGMNDTPERAKQVAFVDYLKVGQGLLVPAGNPKAITKLDDLSGKSVAVQLGTTNKDALDATNVTLTAAGKPKIDIQTFEQDTDAFQQLSLGRVDAYWVTRRCARTTPRPAPASSSSAVHRSSPSRSASPSASTTPGCRPRSRPRSTGCTPTAPSRRSSRRRA